jgi:type IV secretory pathway VirB10-like protein
MGDRKLHLRGFVVPTMALAICLSGCTRQEAKAPAEEKASAENATAEPPSEDVETPATSTRPPEGETEVLPLPPPPPPPPTVLLPVCPGDPRCEGGTTKR